MKMVIGIPASGGDRDFYSSVELHSASRTVVRYQNLFIPSILSHKNFVGGRETILLALSEHFRHCLAAESSYGARMLRRFWVGKPVES